MYDLRDTSRHLKACTLKTGVLEGLSYGCTAWTPSKSIAVRSSPALRYGALRIQYHRLLLRCILLPTKPAYELLLSYAAAIEQTERQSIGSIVGVRRLLYAGRSVKMCDDRLPKETMFGKLEDWGPPQRGRLRRVG